MKKDKWPINIRGLEKLYSLAQPGDCPLPEPGENGTVIYCTPVLIRTHKQPDTNSTYDEDDNISESERFNHRLIRHWLTGEISFLDAVKLWEYSKL